MIINTNVSAMNAHRQMGVNQQESQSAMEKLSSGQQINKAGDDAAGLSISEKMRGQIRGLEQASNNAQDSISLIQTAEGALDESHSILQRMRELSVQSANDTNVGEDREALQAEVDELAGELSRIADNTEFNSQELLNDSFDGTFQIGANEGQNMDLKIGDMGAESLGVQGEIHTSNLNDHADFDGEVEVTSRTGEEINIITKSDDNDGNDLVENTTAEVVDGNIEVTLAQEAGDDSSNGSITATKQDVVDAINNVSSEAGIEINVTDDTNMGDDVTATGDTTVTLDDNAWEVDDNASAESGINISTQEAANSAITAIDDAIASVSEERSGLGAVQNRLEHTISNLDNASENLSAAESRIRDTDMAEAMMDQTQANILNQASQSMLAQANQQPQQVLQLLQ